MAALMFGPAVASARVVKVEAGRFAPSGTARVSGALPKGKRAPNAFVLSRNDSFGAGDARLAAVPAKARRGHYRAWLSLADDARTGTFRLLGCRAATPSRRVCFVLGKVKVRRARPARLATPVLDPSRAGTTVFTNQSNSSASNSLSVTGADGTTYTRSAHLSPG
jgi:hypothetical protein